MSESEPSSSAASLPVWRWLVLAVVATVGVTQGASLWAPFLGDDYRLIAGLSRDGGADLGRWWSAVITPLGDTPGPRFWRPAWHLSLAVDLALWGPDPLFFHLSNLALHATTAIVLGGVALRLGLSRSAAIGAACLFTAWPAHQEAVAWVSARCGLLAQLFLVGTLWLALRGSRAAPLSAVVAMLSKEPGFLAAPLCTVALALQHGPREAVRRTAPLWCATLAVLAARAWILGTPVGGYPQVPLSPLRPGFLAAQASTLGSLVSTPLAVTGPIVAGLLGVSVCGLLLAALRRPDHAPAWRLAFAWLALAWVPISPFLVDPATHQDGRFLYGLAVPLALGLAIAHERLRLSPAPLVLVVLALTVWTQGPRRAAAQAGSAVISQAQVLALDGQGSLVVLAGVPDKPDGVVVGRNAFPDALRPLFTGALLTRPAIVLTDTPEGRARLRGLEADTAQDPDARFLAWDPETRSFSPR